MQVVCSDGTTLQCADFEAIDAGVLLYGEGEEEDEEKAIGFIPITELRYVLPEGVRPQAQQGPMMQPGGPAGGRPAPGQQPRSRQPPGRQQPGGTGRQQPPGGGTQQSGMQSPGPGTQR